MALNTVKLRQKLKCKWNILLKHVKCVVYGGIVCFVNINLFSR